MIRTRTGGFEIGFRDALPWKADYGELLEWARSEGFTFIDVTADARDRALAIGERGLAVGAVDLSNRTGMLAQDARRRKAAVEENRDLIRRLSSLGVRLFLAVMLPEDPSLERRRAFGYMVESYGELVGILEECDARLVVEGWPGPGCACCTPEGFRSFLTECSSDRVGINYDPSHLIRMGIDPLRFLREFADRVFHLHAKDTEILTENLYEYGCELGAIFTPPIRYGALSWRYTIPGHGLMRWSEAFRILEENGFGGSVAIELEDANFCDGAESARMGLRLSASFLSGC